MDREVFPPREYRNSNCKIALTIEGSEKIRFVLFQRLEIRLLRSRATCGKSDRIRENSQKRIGCRKTENESMKAMGLRTLAIKWATVECLFPHKWPNSVGFPLKAKLFAKTLDDTPPRTIIKPEKALPNRYRPAQMKEVIRKTFSMLFVCLFELSNSKGKDKT